MGGYFSKSEEQVAPAPVAIAEESPIGISSGTVGGKKRRSKTRRGSKKGGRRHKTGKANH